MKCTCALVMMVTIVAPLDYGLGQVWEQVYPQYPYPEYTSIINAGTDTMYAAGMNFTLLRTTDAGRHWETLYSTNGSYNIERIGYDGVNVYLLPSGRRYISGIAGDTTYGFLYSYDIRTGDTTRITYPHCIRASRNGFADTDMSVTSDAITILQYQYVYGGTPCHAVIQSTDRGMTWTTMNIPDSLNNLGYASVVFRNRLTGMLIATESYGKQQYVLYSTRDGGATWKRHQEILFAANSNTPAPMLYPVQWVDDTTALAIPQDHRLYITHDKADSWHVQSDLPTVPSGIAMLPNGNGYLSGMLYDVYKTTDYGISWIKIRDPLFMHGYYNQGCANGDSSFVAITMRGDRICTTDQGYSWISEQVNVIRSFTMPRFFSPTEGVCGYRLDGQDQIYVLGGTADGGRTWQVQSMIDNASVVLRTSPAVAYACRYTTADSDTLVMVTRDAGHTWGVVLRDLAKGQPYPTNGVMNRGDDTVFVLTTNGILKTYDGGRTWSYEKGLMQTLQPGESINMLDMRHKRYSWFSTTRRLLRSSDDGATWDTVLSALPGGESYDAVALIDSENVAIYACDYSMNGIVYNTADGGATWRSYMTNEHIAGALKGLQILNRNGAGIAVASERNAPRFGNGYQIGVFTTTDFWQTYRTQYTVNFMYTTPGDLVFLDGAYGWMFLGNKIYATHTGGIDAAEREPSPVVPWLAQSYPNPTSANAVIPYVVDGNSGQCVRIELFDALGRRMRVLFEGAIASGEHLLSFDTGGMVPGMYVVVLTAGEKRVMRNMIVAR